MADTGQNTHGNGGAGTGNARHDRQPLDQPDDQGVLDGKGFEGPPGVGAALTVAAGRKQEGTGQEQHGAGNQGRCEEAVGNAVQGQSDGGGGDGAQDNETGQTNARAIAVTGGSMRAHSRAGPHQASEDVQDITAKIKNDRRQGADMDADVERQFGFAQPVEVLHQNEMPGTADG